MERFGAQKVWEFSKESNQNLKTSSGASHHSLQRSCVGALKVALSASGPTLVHICSSNKDKNLAAIKREFL